MLFYAIAGLAFAIPFVTSWAARLDPKARDGSFGFRLVILPGTVAFWPVLVPKLLRAGQSSIALPDPARPVAPPVQRLIHGVAIVALSVVLPLVCGVALFTRPGEQLPLARGLHPAPLPTVVPLEGRAPDGLGISVALRTDGTRDQVELDVARSLEEPIVALFWSHQPTSSSAMADGIFLGSVWGPAKLLFDLPPEIRGAPGVLTFVALAGEQRVLATLPLKPL